jgi:hypothetical protein
MLIHQNHLKKLLLLQDKSLPLRIKFEFIVKVMVQDFSATEFSANRASFFTKFIFSAIL